MAQIVLKIYNNLITDIFLLYIISISYLISRKLFVINVFVSLSVLYVN